jgi:anti-sigma28 factor (negative regulator of flagellin synthesis)
MDTEVGDRLEELMTLPGVSQMLAAMPAGTAGNAKKPDNASDLGRGAALMARGDEEVRMEKVLAIRAALATGSYYVSASAVAAKMLNAMILIERERPRQERRKRPRVGHRGLLRGSGSNSRLHGATRRWRG